MAIESEKVIGTAPLSGVMTPPAERLRVPPLIWRNSILLLAAEAFVGTSQQMIPTLGAIMALSLTGSTALGGMASSITGLTRFLASYPSGRLADRLGRKAILIVGLLLSLAGAIGLGTSMRMASLPAFIGALLLFGIGNGTSQQQRRLSAADMYPPLLRGRGLGLVLSGSIIGALGGPIVIHVAGVLARGQQTSQIVTSWFLLPAVLLPSLVLILLIHPDPRTIALSLSRYYPGYRAPEKRTAHALAKGVTLWTYLRNYPQLVALVCMFVLYANMSMMMALTPMNMTREGMSLAEVSLTVSIHVVGMYALSLPIGRLTDAFGRRQLLFAGVGISTVGTVFAALTTSYPLIMTGLFLIGVGWSCGNISTAALVADTTPPEFRGGAMGANSSLSALASVVAPLLGGVLIQFLGPASLASFTALIMLPTLGLLVRLRETSPGVYAHTSTW
jgi:MFS family permease